MLRLLASLLYGNSLWMLISEVLFKFQLKTVRFRNSYQFNESVHGNSPVIDPVINRPVAQFHFSRTELPVKLSAPA